MKKIVFPLLAIICLTGMACEEKEPKKQINNVEDLHAQPLHIIQECVQGKWKVIRVSRLGIIGFCAPTNTVVNIENNSAVIAENGNEFCKMNLSNVLNETSSYTWEEKEVYQPGTGERPPCYTTYVMQFNKQNNGFPQFENIGWYFESIKNDTLSVVVDFTPANFAFYEHYLFVRIKDNNP